MKIAFLTSSRADYGIYLPLLKAMNNDPYFEISIIAFGTHLSSFHGNTIELIQKDGFKIDHKVEHILASDSEEAIATSMALASMKFTSIWEKEKNNYDLVFCLGDRYEMFAAVSSAVPFGIRLAHIHGGETTLGAIDNKFRDCLSHFSLLHFAATEDYAERIRNLVRSNNNVFNVGALSLDNLTDMELLSEDEMKENFGIDFSIPTLLITYHPETAGMGLRSNNGKAIIKVLKEFVQYQLVITMPNADTNSISLRKAFEDFASTDKRVKLVENFGTRGYFTAMQFSKLVIGNSSSGIIEAASFNKYVVNIGGRQEGRAVSANVINASNDVDSIRQAVNNAVLLGDYSGANIYYNGGATQKIVQVLKEWK